MIPKNTDLCWQRIVVNEAPIDSNFVALNMFIFNVRLKHRKDPSQRAALGAEVYNFVQKYQKVLKNEDFRALGI